MYNQPPSYMPPQTPVASAPAGKNGFALAGLICSIIGLLPTMLPPVLGIIFSAIGISKSGQTGRRKGMAITGLVLGCIGVVLIPVYMMSLVILVRPAIMSALDDAVCQNQAKQYFMAINAEQYEDAYKMTSPAFQEKTSFGQFRSFCEANRRSLGEMKGKPSFGKPASDYHDGVLMVQMSVTVDYANKKNVTRQMIFAKIGDKWLIQADVIK